MMRPFAALFGTLLSTTMWVSGVHAQTDTVTYMHTDGIGSVRMLTNETAQVVARFDYLPFGEPCTTACGTSASTATTRQFTGQEKDTESGLDYFGARYYRNIGGRFITVDPDHVGGNLFDPQSWNAYAYARNNPLAYVDPTGTDYFINIDNGGSFSFVGDFSQFKSFAWGFDVGTNQKGGVIYNAAGKRVGTFRYYDPYGFDAFAYQTGQLAAAELKYGTIGMGLSAAGGAFVGLGVGIAGGGAGASELLGVGRLAASIRPSPGQLAQMRRVLESQGRAGVEKALRSLERRLAEHLSKIDSARKAGGYTSSLEREVQNFRELIAAARKILGK